MLDRIRHEAEMAINEIRELAYGLRPPALDELGLLGAVKVKSRRASRPPDRHRGERSPAAARGGRGRGLQDRHGGAHQRRETQRRDSGNGQMRVGDGCLAIDISDNGNAGGEWVPGIGLTSMRERASELGGTVTYHGTPAGSTVTAQLPLETSGPAARNGG
jgi:signal transduction histidine kinase